MVRFGIWGTGAIAGPFAKGATQAGAEIVAVGARSMAKARAFAEGRGIAHAHEGLEALAADQKVEVVYIASPNGAHEADALGAIAAGKAVLCEKPLATTVRSAERIFAAARRANVFSMEAMWTRFFPVIASLEATVRSGAIGEVRLLEADFGFAGDRTNEPRIFDRDGGGALLDVGVYPLWLATFLLGPPIEIKGSVVIGPTGADESAAAVLRHAGGALSMVNASIVAETRSLATITGTRGRIELGSPWWRPSGYVLHRAGHSPEPVTLPYLGNGYGHEVLEVAACLAEGRLESQKHPHATTIEVLRQVEVIRRG